MSVLQMMVGSNISEKRLCDIVDKTMEDADIDKDGKIGFGDFKKVIFYKTSLTRVLTYHNFSRHYR